MNGTEPRKTHWLAAGGLIGLCILFFVANSQPTSYTDPSQQIYRTMIPFLQAQGFTVTNGTPSINPELPEAKFYVSWNCTHNATLLSDPILASWLEQAKQANATVVNHCMAYESGYRETLQFQELSTYRSPEPIQYSMFWFIDNSIMFKLMIAGPQRPRAVYL